MKRVLFHRQFHGYSGGHGKIWDYVGHVDAHPGFQAATFLTPDSTPSGNPWAAPGVRLVPSWRPREHDLLFLGGLDWLAGTGDPRQPVLNLVQGLRHADADDARRAFLARPAIRICVSQAIADALQATGEVNGPVHVIPAGLALPAPAPRPPAGAVRVVIAGSKAPGLAAEVAAGLAGGPLQVDCLPDALTRAEFLQRLSRADIAVLLPHAREGFFLPGLEAMALGTAVVMPDAGGNREYAQAGHNALMPARDPAAIVAAVLSLADAEARQARVSAGHATAAQFTLGRERSAFHAILDRLDQEWAACRHLC